MSTSDATEPSSLAKEIGKSVEEPGIEIDYGDLEVCMGDLLEGLETVSYTHLTLPTKRIV